MTDWRWRTMSNEEREELPLGSPGWRYTRGTTLPRGQYFEELAEPDVGAQGQVVTKIRWGSNGVGPAQMTLVGSTKDYVPDDPVDGYYPLPAGAFMGFKPADGSKGVLKREKTKP